nr:EOG090X04Z9 [Sida crystallina]
MKAANSVSNMQLAHEIAVDNNFHLKKVEPPSSGGLHKMVKEMVQKAFWDLLKEELEQDPPEYNRALILLEEIKEWLLSLLLPHQTKTQAEVKEKLDVDLIRQQVEAGTLDMHSYSQYIVGLMARLCAPGRDEKIRELTSLKDVVQLYKGIFETLELMRLDMANFTIRQIRPHIAANAVEYERTKFEEYLKITPDGLRNTREWLYRHRVESSSCSGSASSSTDALHAISTILVDAFMELLQWDGKHPWPETVAMDEVRFCELRNKLSALQLRSSILLVALSQSIGPLQTSAEFRNTLKEHVSVLVDDTKAEQSAATLTSVVAQVIKDINAGLVDQHLSPLTAELTQLITGQLMDLLNPSSRVRQIIHTRIMEFLKQVISSDIARPTQIPPGLSLFRSEIATVAGQLARLVSHNRAVFAQHYADLIQKHCID